MADTTKDITKTTEENQPKNKGNWAEMADEEEEDQEIGVKDKQEQQKKPAAPVEEKKKFDPPAPREKTSRGDYVVTKFSIPDRVTTKQDKTKVCLTLCN